MLLRTISNTKKFFQKTVENFKSLLSGGYERLPKNSPCSSFPCGGGRILHQIKYSQSYRELDKFHTDYSTQRDAVGTHDQTIKGRTKKKGLSTSTVLSRNESRPVCENLMNYTNVGDPEKSYDHQAGRNESQKKKKIVYEGKRYQDFSNTKVLQEERSFLVAKKLKELEMLDKSNMEHVLDVEEVLHYYSRLTCPAYVEIVDRFFMDMYAELLNGQASSRLNINSRPILQRVGF